jgi:class 3 adenylate cyclase/tetratricopeptide (TPR) repeat protein
MGADLTPYVPRLVLEWDDPGDGGAHEKIEGTLVFADVSGFTRLSERLALAGGRLGAEQLTEVIDEIFDQLLRVAIRRGGEMLKYGGDAALIFFRGPDHAPRAVAASMDMQQRLHDIGRVDTGAGVVRMRMSVGVHTGDFDMFLVGGSHRELVIGGPDTTRTIEMEAAAAAGEVLVSDRTAACLPAGVCGAERDGARLVRRAPAAPKVRPVVRDPDDRAAAYLPPVLRDHLLGGSVEAEHRLVTQAFVHLSGLDGLLEREGGTGAADALHGTIATIQEAFLRYGVTFLASDIAPDGVKVIAVTGAPGAVEEPEARTVAALRAVRDARTPLPIRAGIHCGHVFTGDVGPVFRRTYTTIGDVTNTAARVMAHAPPGEVLTLGPLAEAVGALYTFEELPPFTAKGKAEPLVPYRLGAAHAEVGSPSEAPDEASALPFTGREAELERLVAAASSAETGAGTVVEVSGPVGIGKTRLVNEALARAGVPARRLACEPYEASTPYFVVGHLLRTVIGPEAASSAAGLRAEVCARCPSIGPWLPLLAEALDVESDDTPETAALDPRFRRQRTAAAIIELLDALLTVPTVLVFEDVQWADDSSSEVLRHLEEVVGSRPWTIVLTRRDAEGGHRVDAGLAEAVQLAPLDEAIARALVEAATREDPLPPYRVEQIVRRSEGNPLFTEGLLRMPVLGDEDEPLPDSIEAAVATQIDGLTATARRVLRLAAVHGNSLELDHLVATARQDGIELPLRTTGEVATLTGGSLVADGKKRLRFRHHVLRDVAYGGLPFRQRREFHGHAADVLLAETAEVLDDRVGRLALHEWHAGRYGACWEHSRLAGERAAAKYAHAEAAAYLQRAISAARQLPDGVPTDDLAEVWEQLGNAEVMTGEAARASAAFKQARRRTTSDATFARLCGKEARLAELGGGRPRARRWLRRGLAAIEASDEPDAGEVAAGLLARSAWTAEEDGRHRVALDLARRAAQAGLEHGNLEATGTAYLVLDGASAALGSPEVDHSEEALSLFEAAGATAAKASALNNLGARAYYRSDWTAARRYYDEARVANLAAGNVVEAGYQSYNTAEILIDQGVFARAEELLDDLDALWRSVRFGMGLTFARGLRGVLELRRRRLDDARALLDDARGHLHDAGLRIHALGLDLASAEALLLLGETSAAEAALEALSGPVVTAVPGAEAHLFRLRGAVHALEGEADRARELLKSGVERARTSAWTFQLLLTSHELANVELETAAAAAAAAEVDRLRIQLGVEELPPPLVRAHR